jgi:hypothetical protein
METVTRNVNDLEPGDRRALEHVIGIPLSESQQLVIQVVETKPDAQSLGQKQQHPTDGMKLPDWCNVYEGLSDAEIDEIEKSIVRSPSSRSFD